jgi:hypothetical protein
LTAQYAQAAGFTGDELVIAIAVAGAESSWYADAYHDNTTDPDPGIGVDRGLWQINSYWWCTVPGLQPSAQFCDYNRLLTDGFYNAQAAYYIRTHTSSGWEQWNSYTSDRYLQDQFWNPAVASASKLRKHIVTGIGTGIGISNAIVTLTAGSTPQTISSQANGFWLIPPTLFPTSSIRVTIVKTGYKILDYTLHLIGNDQYEGTQLAQADAVTDYIEDPLVPHSIAPTSTRLQVDDRVQVTNTGIGLRARYPLYDSPPLDVMSDGEQGKVIGGPVGYNGYQWWLIKYDRLSPTLTWSAEGEPATPGVYYLTTIAGAQPVLSVSPGDQSVGAGAGLAYFNVSNTGNGAMNWSAGSNDSWLHITSGASGTNSGTIQPSCDANSGSSQRIGTIHVTATGAFGSPKDVTVTQAGAVTPPPQRPDMGLTYQSLNGPEILPGDFTPSTSDGTDFDHIPISDVYAPAYRTFVIQNFGDGTLQFTGSPLVQVAGNSDFAIYSQPPVTSLPPWAPGNTPRTGFTVVFDPHSPAGLKTAIISIPSNEANHSPYQFAIQGTGVLPVLSVTSNGASDVPILASPSDSNAQGFGATPLSLSYDDGTQVTLTAPATIGASVFTGWTNLYSQGESQNGTTAYVIVNFDRTVTANYSTPVRTLTIQSGGTAAVLVGVSPADRNGQSDGTTNFARSYDNGAYVALTAPSTSGGNVFIDWSGVDGQINTVGYVTTSGDKTATANYAVVPLDLDGDGYVNDRDFTAFVACALGPPIPQNDPACQKADFDQDGDVDMDDFAVLQRCWSGTALADPKCAN